MRILISLILLLTLAACETDRIITQTQIVAIIPSAELRECPIVGKSAPTRAEMAGPNGGSLVGEYITSLEAAHTECFLNSKSEEEYIQDRIKLLEARSTAGPVEVSSEIID